MLVAILAPAWLLAGANARTGLLAGLMSPWLPVALAMMVSVQAGGLDLGVWGMASLGSVISWHLVSRGWPVPLALLSAMCAGAVVGAVLAAVMRLSRLPMWLLTLLAGGGAAALAHTLAAAVQMRSLPWEVLSPYDMHRVQILLAAGFFIATMALLSPRYGRRLRQADIRLPRWWGAHMVLIPSGALAAGGGVLLMICQSDYLGGLLPIGDLRVAAAVLLCGAAAIGGHGGRLLNGLLLPIGMLVATMWWLQVWDIGPMTAIYSGLNRWAPFGRPGAVLLAPLDFNVLVLLALTLGIVWLCGRRESSTTWRAVTLAPAWLGVATMAMGAYWAMSPAALWLRYAGLGCYLAGATLGLFRWLWRALRSRPARTSAQGG